MALLMRRQHQRLSTAHAPGARSRRAAGAVPRARALQKAPVAVCAAGAAGAAARFGGGGVMDRPADAGVDLSKRGGWDADRDSNVATLPPRTDTGRDGGSTDDQRNAPPGGGNHRLLLLRSAQHTEPKVVKNLVQVVNCEEGHARNCYATAQQLGMAMVVSCLKEHAEHYMQQLYRAGVRTAIEPDTSTA